MEELTNSDIRCMSSHHLSYRLDSQVAPLSMDPLDDIPLFNAKEKAYKTLAIKKELGLSFLILDEEAV